MRLLAWVFLVASASLAADPRADRDAKKDLSAMQGRWRLVESESSFATNDVIKGYMPGYQTELNALRIEGNKLSFDARKEPVVIANDLRLGGARVAVKEGNALICFTFADGRGMTGSYKVEGDKLEIRVPETCICTRTGIIARYERVKD